MSEDQNSLELEEESKYMDALNAAEGATWPAFAIAAALLDKGLIDKETLIKITSALIMDTENALGIQHSSSLVIFRRLLLDHKLKEGDTVRELCQYAIEEHLIKQGDTSIL